MIAEIHVSPSPSGTDEQRYAHVEAAIAVVESSGLTYEVGALGTTFEGDADDVWRVLRAAHEATLASGANSVITNIRLGASGALPAERATIASLTGKFRT